jgi:hypothetical protein
MFLYYWSEMVSTLIFKTIESLLSAQPQTQNPLTVYSKHDALKSGFIKSKTHHLVRPEIWTQFLNPYTRQNHILNRKIRFSSMLSCRLKIVSSV